MGNGDTNFRGATFSGKESINFKGVIFSGNGVTKFKDAKFISQRETAFIDAKFLTKKGVDFEGAIFSSEITLFEKCKFKSNTLMIEVRFLSIITSFINIEIENVSFKDTLLENVEFKGVIWGKSKGRIDIFKRPLCFDEKEIPHFWNKSYEEKVLVAEDACRNLKLSYRKVGNYDMAGSFFIGKMECKRKNAFYNWYKKIINIKSFFSWIFYEILKVTSGYGERISNVFVFSGLIVFIFAGLVNKYNGITTKMGVPYVPSFLNSLYFSAVTFTTLGFGDFTPFNIKFRMLSAFVAFIGAFMMATFVLVFARKMTR